MIKNLIELKNKPEEYQKEFFGKCTIEEKIDAHYVCVEVASKSKLIFKKASGKIISQIDLILSTLYAGLVEDWNALFINNREFFEKNVGMNIFMFYFPNKKPVSVDYSNFLCGKKSGYLISNIVDKNNKQISKEYVLKNISCFNNLNIVLAAQQPLSQIKKDNNVMSCEIDKDNIISMIDKTKLLNHEDTSLSEGVIMKYKTDIYQYLFREHSNEEDAEYVSRTPFEYLLTDILLFYNSIKKDFQDYLTNNYVTSVCNIFNAYISSWVPNSNIIKEIDAKDIEAPSAHKYSINTTYIPNVQTKLICSTNKTYENIFKVMLANMRKKKNYNYCVYLSKKQVDEWNNLVSTITCCTDCDF